MTDYFALLDEPRRLWLDPERLKAKFLTRSAEAHPDKVHAATPAERDAASRCFAELNAAFNCLREPRERLRHLLELELGATPKQVQEIPAALTDLFTEIARLRREVDAFLTEAARVQSPLLRVQVFERAQAWIDRVRAVQPRLSEHQAKLHQELQALDVEWIHSQNDPVQRGVLFQRVEQIHQQLSFYTRWSAQLQDTIVQLSL
jgi:DnaJ-domain-containing protein 1